MNNTSIESARKTTKERAPKLIKPVVNSIAILRLLTTVTKPMTVSQIASELGLNLSTCFYILRTLVHERMIKFDADNRSYAIGVGVLDLLQGALVQGGAMALIRPMMEKVARTYGITVTVWRCVGEHRWSLAAMGESDAALRIQMRIGQRVPLLVGAMGRLVAAYSELSETEIKRQFNQVRWQNPIKFETFQSQVKKAKRVGWAVDDGYYSVGTVTLSIPVFDQTGQLSMACSGTLFKGQHDAARIKEIAEELQKIGARLSPETWGS
jgi:DNA-binding IclR family transcriptional regulator